MKGEVFWATQGLTCSQINVFAFLNAHVIFSIFILKVCYPKGHLLRGGIWAGPGEEAGQQWQPHFWRLFWLLHPTWPVHHDLSASGLHWDHLSMTSVSPLHLFSCPHICFAFLYNWEINGFKNKPSQPLMDTRRADTRDCVPQWPTTWPFVCVLYPVCTCVSEWPKMSAWVLEFVSCTQIYCTIQLPLFANVESYRMNWTVKWSKSYAIICGQLLNFFYWIKKKNFGLPHIYNYMYASYWNWEKPWRTPYFLLTITWI